MALLKQKVTIYDNAPVTFVKIDSINKILRASQLTDFAAFKAALAKGGAQAARLMEIFPQVDEPPRADLEEEA